MESAATSTAKAMRGDSLFKRHGSKQDAFPRTDGDRVIRGGRLLTTAACDWSIFVQRTCSSRRLGGGMTFADGYLMRIGPLMFTAAKNATRLPGSSGRSSPVKCAAGGWATVLICAIALCFLTCLFLSVRMRR